MVRASVSANTVEASERETPCFFRFSEALASSHSKVKLIDQNIRCFAKAGKRRPSASRALNAPNRHRGGGLAAKLCYTAPLQVSVVHPRSPHLAVGFRITTRRGSLNAPPRNEETRRKAGLTMLTLTRITQ